MKITVFGTGYVGLVTGAGLSAIGHSVICVDRDKDKIDLLHKGIMPIYEYGLEDLVNSSVKNKTLDFLHTHDYRTKIAINDSDCIFVAVGTPSNPDGSANLDYVKDVIDYVSTRCESSKPVIIKSTVPPGTCKTLQEFANQVSDKITILSNPEFLREGLALKDFFNPERIVVGNDTNLYTDLSDELYKTLNSTIVRVDTTSAELIKYASNAMLATRISFMNELSLIADRVGANIRSVELGVGLDSRIGQKFLSAGLGYGGSCFPKDVSALASLGSSLNVDCKILNAVMQRNEDMIEVALNKILESGCRSVLFFGVAFKPGTDDTRESASVKLIEKLIEHEVLVHCYDPIVTSCGNLKIYNNLNDVYCLPFTGIVIGTELSEVNEFDFQKAKQNGAHRIFDFRNKVTGDITGYEYITIGNKRI